MSPSRHRAGPCAALLATCLALSSTPTLGEELAGASESPAERPRLGLVLAGGGARGAAHIGVLRVLEEAGLRPDVIAGTSMGAIVGGLYATGLSADQLVEVVESIDWTLVFSDDPGRPGRTVRRKQLDRDLLVKRRLGFNRGGLQFPTGALQGQQLDKVLRRALGDAVTVTDFDELPIPFRAVATDLATGEAVVLGGGSLVSAIRASMSVPAVFAPVQLDGRLLVDGGVAMNVPVEVAQAMGADRLIVVDLSTPLAGEDELDSVFRVTQQLTSLLTLRNARDSLARMGPDDILVTPDLEGLGSAEFDRALEAVASGEQAARLRLTELEALARLRGPVTSPGPLVVEVAHAPLRFIDLDNRSPLNDSILWSRLRARPGEPLDVERLEQDLDALFALDVFEAVRYDLVADEERGLGVLVTAEARRWGPNYLQFGIALESDFDAVNDFTLGMAYTRNVINRLGGEVRARGSIGQFAGIELDLYQPLDGQASWFIEPSGGYRVRRLDLFEAGRPVATTEQRSLGGRLAVGRNFGNVRQLRVELERANERVVGLRGEVPGLGDTLRIGGLALAGVHDDLDNLNFPSSGTLAEFRWFSALPALGANARWDQLELGVSSAWSAERWSLLGRGALGLSRGDPLPLTRQYRIGGFGRLSGLAPGESIGEQSAVVALAAYRRIGDLRFLPLYGGVSLEAGNTWQDYRDLAFDDLLVSGAVFVGLDTLLGPLYLAFGRSDRGDSSFYFYLGNPFELARR